MTTKKAKLTVSLNGNESMDIAEFDGNSFTITFINPHDQPKYKDGFEHTDLLITFPSGDKVKFKTEKVK